jgi:Phosphotransferase enzyme family
MKTTAATRRPDEEVLRECLERVVTDLGGGSPIIAVERQRSQFSSFYASDVVTVHLASGGPLRVFLKDFGTYDHPKDGLTGRRERERVVYRDLLAGAGLGTARYYGSAWDASQGRFWLLLEYVEGEPVKHYGFDYWVPPAAWLGRMQGYFARRPDLWRACEVLIRHDAAFFHATAEQALRSASQFSPEFSRRLEPVVRQYDPAVQAMASQPPTFLHGTYRPAQIIVDPTQQPLRFCPVDWEKAAVGSGLYDLTFLADGFTPPRLDVILDAYRDEARAAGLAVPGSDEMRHVMDCFRLHRVMNWLSLAADRKFPPDKVVKLLDRVEEVGKRVL